MQLIASLMERSKIMSKVRNFLSLVVFAWTLVTLPMALTTAVLDVTKWSRVLVDPTATWQFFMDKTFDFWPFQGLPLWALSMLYIATMFAGAILVYRNNVTSVARRQLKALEQGEVTREYPTSFAEVVVGGAAGVGLLWGLPILKAFTYGVAIGPVGWALLAVFASIAALFGLSTSADRKAEEMRRIAQTNVAYFAEQETNRFMWALGLATLFVLLNFGLVMVF